MGKRPAEDELFVGNMGSIQREVRTSMQREDKPTMETGLERIAAKARSEPKLRFTSLAHHITRERVWTNLCQIPKRSAPGVDGQTVTEAKETFGEWVEPVLRSVHRQGYRADPGTDQDQARRMWPVRATTCRQTRQEAPRDDLLSGVHALLHAEPEGQLQDWNAHREISLAAQSHVTAGQHSQ